MDQASRTHLLRTAVIHHQSGRIAEAKAIYLQILAECPDDPDALHLLGLTALQSGDAEKAIELINRAIAINPNAAEYYNNLSHAHRARGALADAIRALQRAVQLRPDSAETHNNLGNALREAGQVDAAIASCRQAIRLKPTLSEAYNNLGAALCAAGSFDEAIPALRTALRLKPDIPECYNNLGNAHKGKRQLDEALAFYRQAIRLRPAYAEAHYNLGIMLRHKGLIDDAIAAYRQAIQINPQHAAAHFSLGVTLKRQQRFDEAAAELREAIRLKPDSPGWQYELAAIMGDHSVKTAPARYVQKLFDDYAPTFDDHLVNRLKYQVPGLLLQAVLRAAPQREFDILDLGCGTGLCGVQFKPHARRMVGVDLSPEMLKVADARKIYDQLITGDIIPTLRAAANAYDLILAGDVLIYVGDLTDVMPAIANALRPGGLFACSIENYEGDGFVLHTEVRFAHSLAYFRTLATASELTEVSVMSCCIRQHEGHDVPGWIILAQKPWSGP